MRISGVAFDRLEDIPAFKKDTGWLVGMFGDILGTMALMVLLLVVTRVSADSTESDTQVTGMPAIKNP